MRLKSKTPRQGEPSEGAAIGVTAPIQKTNSEQSIAHVGRSSKYPTHYLVGSLNGCDVYWHPQLEFAIERNNHLVELTTLSGITWFKGTVYARIVRDMDQAYDDAKHQAAAFYDRVGHDMAYGLDHPAVI